MVTFFKQAPTKQKVLLISTSVLFLSLVLFLSVPLKANHPCDGSSCHAYRITGEILCDACCPEGQSASCSPISRTCECGPAIEE